MTAPGNPVDSRVWRGSFTMTPAGAGGTAADFTCQVTNLLVTGDYDNDGDPESTLCGAVLGAPRRSSGYHLSGTFIQDFDNPNGLNRFTYDHELEDVPFVFIPNDTDTTPTVNGVATVEFADLGGDVRTRVTSDFDWICANRPVIDWPDVEIDSAAAAPATSQAAAPAVEQAPAPAEDQDSGQPAVTATDAPADRPTDQDTAPSDAPAGADG